MAETLRPASIDWSQGVPLSRDFNDVYFSRSGGADETLHVFLSQNRLPERFQHLEAGASFCIAETGFGTGLNWMATIDLWRSCGAKGWLHFVSVEKCPLTVEDLQRAHSCWPQYAGIGRRLADNYPFLSPGFHRLCFPEWRSTLTLFFGDVADFLPRLTATADAWFLDGFAPDRNPAMWTEALYRGMARRSRASGSFATFTAAGHVRRGLEAAGFSVEKVPGFGKKREMLRGHIGATDTPARKSAKPWLQRPIHSYAKKKACVIGAGIAGAQTAHSLALRGWEVTVIDAATPASGASGNPAAVLYPRLAATSAAMDDFTQQAWQFAVRQLNDLPGRGSIWHPCGVMQLLTGNRADETARAEDYARMPELAQHLDAAAASHIAQVTLRHDALWFPRSGWLQPENFCRLLLQTPGISLLPHTIVQRLEPLEDRWNIYDETGRLLLSSPVVIVANAGDATRLDQLRQLPLRTVRGQISLAPATPSSATLATVVCHDGYITPTLPDGRHCLGATFHPDDDDVSERLDDHRENLALLHDAIPELAALLPPPGEWLGRAALRCQSPDYLPLVGPVADHQRFLESYAGMRDGKVMDYPDPPVLHGLYVNLAHGSKGFSQAALAAEILAAEINGEPFPVSASILNALHPMRFWMRQLKRGK